MRWRRFLWVCLAGALGTGLRYGIGIWAGKAMGAGFPYGTFIVNVAGYFLISFIYQLALTSTRINDPTRS